MIITIMIILAGLSVLYALFAYFFAERTINTNEELIALRTESIFFLLLAIIFLLVGLLYK